MTTLRRLIRYWHVLGAVLDLVDEAMKTTRDGKLTAIERSRLFNRFWDIINAAQMRRRK